MIRTVIFDMDGTLIDTEKIYRIFWPKAMEHFGYEMTEEQWLQLRSLGRPFGSAKLKEWYGEDFDDSAVRAYRNEIMNAYIAEHGIERKRGAAELLTWLKERGYTCAIATATDPVRTEQYLKMVGLREFFDRVISAHMVKEGKPSPDVYLYACEQLGQRPEDCMAVEDSPNGVTSAYRAGCKVVMVPDATQPDEELEAMLYGKADCLTDIIGILEP